MCGIHGIITTNEQNAKSSLDYMVAESQHRGPDTQGVFTNGQANLGHNRLKILDLSYRGDQPMQKGKYVLTFNGEIYNYKSIREDLKQKGHKFYSETDTEVLLEAYTQWGKNCLDKFNGMFSFAIYDLKKGEVFAARDRLGIKPFYYYQDEENFIFSSKVQSIMSSGRVTKKINYERLTNEFFATSMFQRRGKTLVSGIEELLPGHHLTYNVGKPLQIEKYWDFPEEDTTIDFDSAVEEFYRLMEDSVRLRLVSDVPIGAFLSGGLDSSIINAFARKHTNNLKSMTVGYGKGIDPNTEIEDKDMYYSKLLAKEKKLKHIVIDGAESFREQSFVDAIDLAALTDDSRYMTIQKNYALAKKNDMTVILNGQGADELMWGYVAFPAFRNNYIGTQSVNTFMPMKFFPFNEAKFTKGMEQAKKHAFNDFNQYRQLFSGKGLEQDRKALVRSFLGRILQMEDYMSMQNAVECRLPFLDHRVVELIMKTPSQLHMNKERTRGKNLLREASRRVLSEEIVERPKQAFPAKSENILQEELFQIYKQNYKKIMNSDVLHKIFQTESLKIDQVRKFPSYGINKMLSLWKWEERFLEC